MNAMTAALSGLLNRAAPRRRRRLEAPPATAHPLQSIVAGRQLRAVFQPIFDFRTHRYHGYEGLIRGPAGSAYERPVELFALPRSRGETLQLDLACIDEIVDRFGQLQLPGTLFINVSPNTLLDPQVRALDIGHRLRALRIDPGRVVLELTENQKIDDFAAFRDAISDYRRHGLRIAIDDLGEGFSNLRLWSEIQPDYVKIDKHFIQGIGENPLKFHLVSAIHELAEQTGAAIIAEGIENELDFLTVRDLRIHCAQGYYLERPAVVPRDAPEPRIAQALQNRQLFTPRGQPLGMRRTVESLCRGVPTLTPAHSNADALAAFEADEAVQVIPIVDAAQLPIGLLARESLISRFARPYRRELFSRKACTLFMESAPIIVDASLTVQEVGRMMSRTQNPQLAAGFIVTRDGRYLGIGSTQDLMAMITEMQLTAARYANPLTHLPGNVPINEQIDRLIAQGQPFTVCYSDIDHFKPFNDAYGYGKGDEVIEMLAQTAGEISDKRLDFVGHIGGDDFILVFQSADWEARCRRLLGLFDARLAAYLPDAVAAAKHYAGHHRNGEPRRIPIPSLSIGALPVPPGAFATHAEVAATVSQVKRLAKAVPGSNLFIERRGAA